MSTGKVVVFDETLPQDLIVSAITSSGSLPVAFPPQFIDNYVLVDGGVFTNLDLAEAIVKCREEVNDDSLIVVDIIMCFDKAVQIE
jgi:predicted acylesterase/phospholipase RssA